MDNVLLISGVVILCLAALVEVISIWLLKRNAWRKLVSATGQVLLLMGGCLVLVGILVWLIWLFS